MVARGMHYAVDGAKEAEMLRRAGDQNALVEYLNDLWDENWQCDTDKVWDELHRALSNGDLQFDFDPDAPLTGIVLGGRLLSNEDWFIIVHKSVEEVRTIATAASALADDEFRELYGKNVDEFDVLAGERDTLDVFRGVAAFYKKAAEAGRAVIFAVDQ